MKNYWRAVLQFCVCISLVFGSSWSQENACPTLSTVKDVLFCIMNNHPKILETKLEVEKSHLLDDVAKQRPNPSLNSRNLFPVSTQAKGVNSEVDLAQPIEWGGKRQARRTTAHAEKNLIEASLRLTQESIVMDTLLDLQRLRQIEMELEVFEETIATYRHIQRQFQRRSQLTPEQQVSASVFHLAEMDTSFQKSALMTEQNGLFSELEYALGQKIILTAPLKAELLTLLKKRSEAEVNKTAESSLLAERKANLFLSQTEIEKQKSDSWPNLSFGPSYDGNSLGSSGGNHTLGFNISLGVPIWNRNRAGVAMAQKEAVISKKSLEWTQRSIEALKKKWEKQYKLASEILAAGISPEVIESKHKKVESLYDRGFLPSSLVIEAHRQVLEYARHQHEQENLILEAKYRLDILEGHLLEDLL